MEDYRDLASALEAVMMAGPGERGGPGGENERALIAKALEAADGRGTTATLTWTVDGEISLSGGPDKEARRLSFRGLKCLSASSSPASSTRTSRGGKRLGGGAAPPSSGGSSSSDDPSFEFVSSDDSGDERGDDEWALLAPVGRSPTPTTPQTYDLLGEVGGVVGVGGAADARPEDYFYTPECEDINTLRTLSVQNRWLETEFVVSDDLKDVARLTPAELDFYRFLFAFLSAADDLVNVNLGSLQNLFRQKDIQHYYIEQESIETVHSRSYSIIQLMLFNNDRAARAEYVRRAVRDPAILAKISWLDARVAECESVAEKYILMILIEGIFFAASFAAVAYLRVNNMFVVTCQLNTLISRDEAVHTMASCCIYNNYLGAHPKPSPRRVHRLFKEAVAIECEFLRSRLPTDSSILDPEAIYSYVRYSADRLLAEIGLPAVYDEPRPASDFPMALMYANNNTNFFERRSTNYSGSVANDL